MTSATLTIKTFGTYVLVTGFGLLLIPNLWLAPLGFPPTEEIWVRVLGLVACILGMYYWTCALANLRPFFVASVYGRFLFCAGCVGLFLFADAPWQLLIFGAIDLAGAAWTKWALGRDLPYPP
jgi:hypothetical protein